MCNMHLSPFGKSLPLSLLQTSLPWLELPQYSLFFETLQLKNQEKIITPKKSIIDLEKLIKKTTRDETQRQALLSFLDKFRFIAMPDDIFRKLDPVLKNAKEIILAGSGEPLLTPHIVKKLKRIRQLNDTASVQIVTNAQLFTQRRFCLDVLSTVSNLVVSINGLDATYDKIMQGASFNSLQNNLRLIAQLKKQVSRKVRMVGSFIVMRSNVNQLVPFISFLKEFDFDEVYFKPVFVNQENIDIDQELVNTDEALVAIAKAEMEKATTLARSLGIAVTSQIGGIFPKSKNTEKTIEKKPPTATVSQPPVNTLAIAAAAPKEPACKYPWANIYVAANGVLSLCCNKPTIIGSLAKSDFETIWNGQEVEAYRNGLTTQQFYKGCASCHVVAPQSAGCFIKAYT